MLLKAWHLFWTVGTWCGVKLEKLLDTLEKLEPKDALDFRDWRLYVHFGLTLLVVFVVVFCSFYVFEMMS